MTEFDECIVVKDYGCVDGLTGTDRLVILQLWCPSLNVFAYKLYTKHNNEGYASCTLTTTFDENKFGTSLCRVNNVSTDRLDCINNDNHMITKTFLHNFQKIERENKEAVEEEVGYLSLNEKTRYETRRENNQLFSDCYDKYMESIHTEYVLK